MYSNYDVKSSSNLNRSTLYVAVCIAALFVAVLSGTFAYLSASASNNNITGTIADVDITLSVTKLASSSGTASNGSAIIPFDLITSTTLDSTSLSSALGSGCIDSNGYTACDVFKIAVTADNSLDINGYLDIEPSNSSSVITNVKWLLLGSKTATSASNIQSVPTTTSYLVYSNVGSSGTNRLFTNLSTNDAVISTTTTYYYVVVWLEDTGDDQDDVGTYTGTVTFYGTGGAEEGKVTATFD